jgi:hypothetical protein
MLKNPELDCCVEIVMLEKLDCILSKSATRPYIYEYKCECVRTHLCIDPSGRQQSPVIRESSPAIRWQRPIMQYVENTNFIIPLSAPRAPHYLLL